MVNNVIIMAGGSGTRLWPASTRMRPKQFLEAENGFSFIQLACNRADQLIKDGEIIIVTHKNHVPAMLDALSEDSLTHTLVVLAEPEARNTAPALALAAAYLRGKGKSDETVLVMTADHLITPVEKLREDTEKADALARKDFIVSFGIIPSGPETGFGYLEEGESIEEGAIIKAFKEKPDRKTAEEFLKQGGFYWNAGMFVYRVGFFFEELLKHTPAAALPFETLSLELEESEVKGVFLSVSSLDQIYGKSEKISIDYALMEKTDRAALVKATFDWIDIGCWDDYSRLREKEKGRHIEVEASGNFVDSKMPVALCGVDNLIVSVRNGKVLICKKGESQLVKKVVETLKVQGRSELL